MTERLTGIVKWFDPKKGYGFISPDKPLAGVARGKDLFVHISGLNGLETLPERQAVEFEVGTNRGKACAVNVSTV